MAAGYGRLAAPPRRLARGPRSLEGLGRGLGLGLAEGGVGFEPVDFEIDLVPLVFEIPRHRLAEAGVANPVRRIGARRQIGALQLVRALGAGLDAGQPMGDGEVDGLVLAGLEVQEPVVLASRGGVEPVLPSSPP